MDAETDPDALASLALCWGLHGPGERLHALLESEVWWVRGAAAVGCAWSGDLLTDPVRRALVATVLSNDWHPSAWGVNTGVLSLSIGALARAGAKEEILEALEIRLDRGEQILQHSHEAWVLQEYLPDWAEMTSVSALYELATAYALLGFEEFAEREEPALLSELNDVQRRILEKTARAGVPLPVRAIPWMSLHGEIGCPALLRFLEGRAGPLEAPLRLADGSFDETWRAIYRVADPNCREEMRRAVLVALLEQREPAQLLALCEDLRSGAYPHYAGDGMCLPLQSWTPLLDRLAATHRAEAEALRNVMNSQGQALSELGVASFAEAEVVKQHVLGSLQALGRYPRQARELLRRICTREELELLSVEWQNVKYSKSYLALPLLEYVQRTSSPEFRLTVCRTESGLQLVLWTPTSVELKRVVTGPHPKPCELFSLFDEVPDVLRVELDFDDPALGYRIQRRLSELGIASVRRGKLSCERCGGEDWYEGP